MKMAKLSGHGHITLTASDTKVYPYIMYSAEYFLLYFSMNYRDFSVKLKLIISLFQTVKLSLSIILFKKKDFREIVSFS